MGEEGRNKVSVVLGKVIERKRESMRVIVDPRIISEWVILYREWHGCVGVSPSPIPIIDENTMKGVIL